MKSLVRIARAAVLLGVFAVSHAHAALPATLHAATSGDLPPISFVDAHNELDGYDVQVARFVASYLHIPMQLDHLAFKGILPGLQTGRFDIVFSNVNITPERATIFDYSIPYSRSAVVVVVRTGVTDIKSFRDLKGKHIGAIAGANDGEMPARDIEKQYGAFGDFKGYSGYTEMFTDLAVGRLDAVVAPDTSAANMLHQRPGIASMVGEPYRIRYVGAPMPKGSADLKAGVDQAIREMKKQGLLDKWGKQYFGIDHYSAQLTEDAK